MNNLPQQHPRAHNSHQALLTGASTKPRAAGHVQPAQMDTLENPQRPHDGLRGHTEPAHVILDKWSVYLSLEHENLHPFIQSEYPELEGIRIIKSHSWCCPGHPKSHHVSQSIVPMLLELWHKLSVPIFTSPHPGPVTSPNFCRKEWHPDIQLQMLTALGKLGLTGSPGWC